MLVELKNLLKKLNNKILIKYIIMIIIYFIKNIKCIRIMFIHYNLLNGSNSITITSNYEQTNAKIIMLDKIDI